MCGIRVVGCGTSLLSKVSQKCHWPADVTKLWEDIGSPPPRVSEHISKPQAGACMCEFA